MRYVPIITPTQTLISWVRRGKGWASVSQGLGVTRETLSKHKELLVQINNQLNDTK